MVTLWPILKAVTWSGFSKAGFLPLTWSRFSEVGLAAVAPPDKLPPPTRAAVLMALLGIALLGMLLIAGILLGGHWVRRQGYRRGPSVPPDRSPIVKQADASQPPSQMGPSPSGATNDTVIDDAASGKTVQP